MPRCAPEAGRDPTETDGALLTRLLAAARRVAFRRPATPGDEAQRASDTPKGPPKPDISIAEEAFRQQLPQSVGRLLPLYTELADFDRFGTDVAQYMLFVFQLTRVCFWLFILNLSNIIINFEGTEARCCCCKSLSTTHQTFSAPVAESVALHHPHPGQRGQRGSQEWRPLIRSCGGLQRGHPHRVPVLDAPQI